MGRADVDRPLRPDGSEADASDRGVVRPYTLYSLQVYNSIASFSTTLILYIALQNRNTETVQDHQQLDAPPRHGARIQYPSGSSPGQQFQHQNTHPVDT